MSTQGMNWQDPERLEILQYIHDGVNTPRDLAKHSGMKMRRIQRRVAELRQREWIQLAGVRTEPGAVIQIFSLTEEGLSKVPSCF